MNTIELLGKRYPALTDCLPEIERATEAIVTMHRAGAKLLLCGNGGSAADCGHIVGELEKGFLSKRPLSESAQKKLLDAGIPAEMTAKFQQGLCAISLPEQSAILSAFANDVEPKLVYAQTVLACARAGDVFLGISTSGNSENVVLAAKTAKAVGATAIGLTGAAGGKLAEICDIAIRVPATETFIVQEYHLPVYHAICAEVERRLFDEA